jgi:hypothetical protein
MTVRHNKTFKSLLRHVQWTGKNWVEDRTHAYTTRENLYDKHCLAKLTLLSEVLKNEEVRELVLAKCDKNLRADLLAAGVL